MRGEGVKVLRMLRRQWHTYPEHRWMRISHPVAAWRAARASVEMEKILGGRQ